MHVTNRITLLGIVELVRVASLCGSNRQATDRIIPVLSLACGPLFEHANRYQRGLAVVP